MLLHATRRVLHAARCICGMHACGILPGTLVSYPSCRCGGVCCSLHTQCAVYGGSRARCASCCLGCVCPSHCWRLTQTSAHAQCARNTQIHRHAKSREITRTCAQLQHKEGPATLNIETMSVCLRVKLNRRRFGMECKLGLATSAEGLAQLGWQKKLSTESVCGVGHVSRGKVGRGAYPPALMRRHAETRTRTWAHA